MKIIFLSNQLFDYPLKTNKWHVATRVADRGHNVLFVDPPIRFRKLIKQSFQARWSPGRLLSGLYQSSPNLKIFTPVTQAVSESPNLTTFNINRMKKRTPGFFEGDAVLWVYNPAMIDYIDKIPHKLLVYDCVDDYPSMANYKRLGLSEEIAKNEKKIAKRADVIFATTRNLEKNLRQWNENVYYVGNAGDYGRFARVGKTEIPIRQPADKVQITNEEEGSGGKGKKLSFRDQSQSLALGNLPPLDDIPRPRIGFTGAIDDYKVNLPLLVKIAKDHPKKSLVLVGPTGVADTQPDLRELKELDNVYFIGKRPYQEMPSFHAGFDVFIIPYNLNDYTLKGCFPVKFLNALAAGLPVVVTNLPAYEDFADVSYIAKDDEEFGKLIQKALDENSPEKVEARMRVARENSWENKVEKMLHIVSSNL